MGKTRHVQARAEKRRKHPHARGEDAAGALFGFLHRETPPRTWGRQANRHQIARTPGNTPTHVGKTPRLTRRICPWPETPPRTWGRRWRGGDVQQRDGNTPTHVGKTQGGSGRSGAEQKHPHARGEDGIKSVLSTGDEETPPRTWGRHLLVEVGGTPVGNTPTHVGKTDATTTRRSSSRKHPHARGEDRRQRLLAAENGETPPRTWGRRAAHRPARGPCRNTPTHVGKTFACRFPAACARKHPHARGEDVPCGARMTTPQETPPRTWGRLADRTAAAVAAGNTPTHVGKTEHGDGRAVGYRKHPHARGEDCSMVAMRALVSETPPRTWGRPLHVQGHYVPRRNTPTHVGKTKCHRRRSATRWKHPHARGEDSRSVHRRRVLRETPPRTWGRPSRARRLRR